MKHSPSAPPLAVSRTGRISGVAGLAALLGAGLWFVLNGALNADEGFYLLASRLVGEGLRPYRDFGFTQMPLLPYVNLPWLGVWGYDLLGIRLTGLSWVMVTALIGWSGLRGRTGGWAAGVFLGLLLSAPGWLDLAVKGKTYAFAGLTILVGSMALTAKTSLVKRWAMLLGAAALGVATRLPALAFFLPAWLGLWHLTPTWRQRGLALLATVGLGAITLWGVTAGDWTSFWFWVVEYHSASTLSSHVGRSWARLFGLLGGVGVVAIMAIPCGWWKGGAAERWVMVALAVGGAANYLPTAAYAEYLTFLVPALAWSCAQMLPRVWAQLSFSPGWMAAGLVPLTVVGWLSPQALEKEALSHAGQAARFLRENTSAEAVVIASMPEIVVAADRKVPPELTMGKFGLTEDLSAERAARVHMATPESVAALMAQPTTEALVFSAGVGWNFSWSVPSYRRLSDPGILTLREAIDRDYQLAYTNDLYVVFLRRSAAVP